MSEAIKLEANNTYWLTVFSKAGREITFAVSVIDVDGCLMGEDQDGNEPHPLPEQILKARTMNEFQRLRWRADRFKRIGDMVTYEALLKEAYFAMDDSFYTNRLAMMQRLVGAALPNYKLEVDVAALRKYRPDIPIEHLTFAVRWPEKVRDDEYPQDQEAKRKHTMRIFLSGLRRVLHLKRA